MHDQTPRYAPSKVLIVNHGIVPVVGYTAYPPGSHPVGCPLIKSCTAVELITTHGSRWYGFDSAYINSELRMVVVGFDSRDEVRAGWQKVPKDKQL